jgi:hypothetical protein
MGYKAGWVLLENLQQSVTSFGLVLSHGIIDLFPKRHAYYNIYERRTFPKHDVDTEPLDKVLASKRLHAMQGRS